MRQFLRMLSCLSATLVVAVCLSSPRNVVAQLQDHQMPGMPQASPSPSPTPTPTPTVPGHNHMPGMAMPTPSPSPTPTPTSGNSQMPGMNMPAPAPEKKTESHDQMKDMAMPSGAMNMGPLLVMKDAGMSIRVGDSENNLMPMGAMGSGTSWQPASGTLPMFHKQSGDWLLMFHGNAFVGVNSQGGPRGATRFESANWFMPMAYHKLGSGTLQLRSMFSFERFTFPPGGSPLLFQTGETYKGQPLIDRQHPHDFFMELSAQYTLPLGERGTWFVYAGYPGEPALGPVAFMHRASASENPAAPLAHHLQDSTHISFGVVTAGFTYRWLKLEGSIFNGREPDENRYNFDAHKWNSRSARISLAPNQNWTVQLSHGFLRSPEGQEPDVDVRRTTASVQYNKKLDRGNWASAFIWGRNHTSAPGETHNLNGYTLESTLNFVDKNYVYTRLELVDKNELLRPADRARLALVDDHASFRIGAYSFGAARDVVTNQNLSVAVGSDFTLYSKSGALNQLYGAHPVSWKLFVRLRPGKMK
ncbi:MAG TPA: hypothetical protein VLL54_18400 [Pyrinomonadaceae bacterium]|nr:hypothetical protein [Pyrinomonadaceae bacterium]